MSLLALPATRPGWKLSGKSHSVSARGIKEEGWRDSLMANEVLKKMRICLY